MKSSLSLCATILALASMASPLRSQALCDWKEHNGHWYRLTDQMSWFDAEALAAGDGGHLASINDAGEGDALYSMFDVGNLPGKAVYIGFNDIGSEGNFVWTSGEPVSFTNWQSGEPNDSPGFPPNCQTPVDPGEDATMLGFGSTSKWWDAPICYSTYHAIIEVDYDPNWQEYGGHYYRLSGQMSWVDAEAAAVSAGGHLATINTAAEGNAIYSIFAVGNLPGKAVYIGFNDIDSEGNFVWSSGEPVSFTNWQSGEPNDSPGFPPNCQSPSDPGEDATLLGFGNSSKWWDGPICLMPGNHGIIELSFNPDPWSDLGGGVSGINGVPQLTMSGPLTPSSTLALCLTQGAPSALAFIWFSSASTPVLFLGGTLHAFPIDVQLLTSTTLAGTLGGSATFGGGISGQKIWVQVAVVDASTVQGGSLSNGVMATIP